MSAYMCSEKHIRTLVAEAAAKGGTRSPMRYWWNGALRPVEGFEKQVFAMLVAANVASLANRYPKDAEMYEGAEHMTYGPVLPVPAAVTIKLAHCFDYQACEPDDYHATEAYAFILHLVDHVSRYVDGYEAAPWGID